MVKAVYIHVPFCKSICSYCDFCKFIYNEKWAYVYLKALKKEIEDRYMGDVIDTIYIGGGTPSCLEENELIKLLELTKIFKLNQNFEFTFECNLDDISQKLLVILKKYNVNRLSIGIQSFQKNNLLFMQRDANFEDAKEKIKLCRELGFNNINLDLMYAIPGETLKELKKDVKMFLKLEPNHISAYSLILEEHTKAYIDNYSYIDEEIDYKMFKYIEKTLNNVNHYEISNYAIPGFESKHNLTYWNNEEYYGFGLSSCGYIDQIRYENTKNLKKYLLGNYVNKTEILSKEDQMEYEVILGLRKLKGINLSDFYKKYKVNLEDVYDIKPLLKSKDLIKKNNYLFINPSKIYVMNEILVKII